MDIKLILYVELSNKLAFSNFSLQRFLFYIRARSLGSATVIFYVNNSPAHAIFKNACSDSVCGSKSRVPMLESMNL